MEKTLKFLMLEDNPSDALLVERELKKAWPNLIYTRVFTAEKMKEALAKEKWDLVVSDYSMPQFTGIDGLEILKASGIDIPFIMVSGTMGEDIAVAVLKAGAQDYILKDKLHRLVPAVERELLEKAFRKEHKLTTKALDESVALSEAVIEGSPIGISVRDSNGRLLLFNKAWQRIWEYSDLQIEEQKRVRTELKFNRRDNYLGKYQDNIKQVYNDGIEFLVPEIKLSQDKTRRAEWVSQHFYALKNEKNEVERVVVLTEDISKRKQSENRQQLNSKILSILNRKEDWQLLLDEIVHEIWDLTDFKAVGIRLVSENDFPYQSTKGFSDEFLAAENSLLKVVDNKLLPAAPGCDQLVCLCGHVIRQDYDPTLPYFTKEGSFWCNDIEELVTNLRLNKIDLISRTSCIKSGYGSFAIIPLKAGTEIKGLLQFNNYEKNTFTEEIIQFFEEIGVTIGLAFQRIESERRLKASEEQFRSLYENSIMGIFRLSAEGRIMMMNPCLLALLGYKDLQEFETHQESPSEDFLRITRKLYNNIMVDRNQIHQFEAGWIRQDGKNIFVRTTAKEIVNEKDEILYIDGSIEDRTDRMKAARALLESREMYRSLVEKANVGIVTDDLNGNITYFNTKFAELLGYTQEEMSGLTYKDIFHPDDLQEMFSHHNLRVNGKSAPARYVLRGLRKDGTIIDLEIAVDQLLDDEFSIIGTRAFLWDVTSRRQTQLIQKAIYDISTTVRSSESLNELYGKIKEILNTVIDTTNIFVALYDDEKDELSLPFEVDEKDSYDTSPAGKTLTSYVIKQGKPMLFTASDMEKLETAGETENVGSPSQIWLGAPLKTANRIIGLISVQSYDNPQLYSEKDLEILAFVSNEIALAIEKKRSEDNLKVTHNELIKLHHDLEKKVELAVAELRQKDHIIISQSRQAAIGDMISQIAHHWRQPLNIIGVTFQSIREAFEFDELTQEYMDEKTKVTMNILQSLSKTIDDFRNFYQQEEYSHTFDIRETIENTLFLVQSQFENSNIKLVTDIPVTTMVQGSQNEFSQAFLNVITNAFDILLERSIADPHVKVTLSLTKSKVRIVISDNGGGIDKDIQDKLFDLYISTKKGLNNTGVGLYMSKTLIEKNLNGSLVAINTPEGADFIIELPLK
ncbi:MAG: PAS domain S-box protein [Candidatus Cloacimonetes bacterium]|nr:PAS domain S-box protein [Candidatus Cloacimonadota bacterium]